MFHPSVVSVRPQYPKPSLSQRQARAPAGGGQSGTWPRHQPAHARALVSEEDKGALGRKLTLMPTCFLSPSPPCTSLNWAAWIEHSWSVLPHHTFPVSSPDSCYPQLSSSDPIKSSSRWCHLAVPSVTNHSQVTPKTPKGSEVKGRGWQFLFPPCIKFL